MNTEEKSLKLAELMGLRVWDSMHGHHVYEGDIARDNDMLLRPYSDSTEGLAQFASILLKFPEVGAHFFGRWDKFTQECVLDHILRMNGVDIDK